MRLSSNNTPARPRCLLQVGTSGYAYPEWIEAGFYPPGTPNREMFTLYARRFTVTELNYTWYQMPRAGAMERMGRLAPAGFGFAVKLTRTMTHEIDDRQWRGQAARYREGIAPLVQERKLSAVLVQLPPSFDHAPKNRCYLASLLDALQGLTVAVEFRHRSWAADRVFAELERRGVTLVAVDAPRLPHLFPSLDVVTNPDLFYVRFHGRNARGWRSGDMQQQFDYDYTASELKQWTEGPVVRMAARARAGLFFFNNHVRAQAPRNARLLMAQLDEQGLSPSVSAG